AVETSAVGGDREFAVGRDGAAGAKRAAVEGDVVGGVAELIVGADLQHAAGELPCADVVAGGAEDDLAASRDRDRRCPAAAGEIVDRVADGEHITGAGS